MEIDPFDIRWKAIDPLDREVIMLNSLAEAREAQGKHKNSDEYLSADEVKEVIEDPHRIDTSVSYDDRDIFYRIEEQYNNGYARAVVAFSETVDRGIVISWSRYTQPVSSSGIKWRKKQ